MLRRKVMYLYCFITTDFVNITFGWYLYLPPFFKELDVCNDISSTERHANDHWLALSELIVVTDRSSRWERYATCV
jgi:hypothetical protein